MRLWQIAPVVLCGLVITAEVHAQHDFDPSGRRPGGRATGRPNGGSRAPSKPDDKKKPNTDELILRYTKALLASPTSGFPLQKLTELYRTRDGNLAKLVFEFERRASTTSGDEQVNARLALAGVYLAGFKRAEASRVLDELTASHPGLATPRLMRASLAEREGDRATARRNYEAALPLLREAADRERVTRQLMILALDMNDLAAATTRHDELVRLSGGSIFVKKELATELMTRRQYAAAELKLYDVVRAATGDNRALAPALKDLGEALARQKKLDEALTVLDRARLAAGGQAGIRNEILAILTDVYREQGKLTELIAILEKEGGRDAARLVTIGQLLEETGQVERAIQRFRDALAVDGRNVEVRIRLVHLLQTAGQLDGAIREYEALAKAAPDNAEYVFELAETWMQRGERGKALALLAELERRSADKGDVLASVADFYERVEEPARALKVFERLATMPDGDPRHLVDLGARYYESGDRARGIATWKRLPTVAQVRADGLVMLGEVYLEHDLVDDALEALREAVKVAPAGKVVRYRKALAGALERSGGAGASQVRYREAQVLWQELLASAGDDALLARDCRTHLVGIWTLLRELDGRVGALRAKLAASPPNLEAGRLLAEVQRRLGRTADAEATLRTIIEVMPGDTPSMLALERVLVVQRNLAGAIDVLARLVEAEPKKAREYYQRMSQYAAELYRDDDAITYASRALELSPEDAEGHVRLAAMHRRRQENERAMRELRKAIAKNPKLHKAYFDLAELAMSAGDIDEADRLYRQVVRSARDEEFVIRAARMSMQIHLGRGTLETLEHELLPVALGNPQKAVYRRLLVEVYKNLAAPLVQTARFGNASDAKVARTRLAAIGARAVKPLLDALVDDAAAQQRVALEVLGYVQNKGAGPALFNFAIGTAEVDLRVRAMVACGALDDPTLLPRYAEFLAPKGSDTTASGSDPVAVAATWAVARMQDPKAEPLLVTLVRRGAADVRALAALGLGLSKQPKHGAELAKITRAPEAGPVARAAAALALGELGDRVHRPLLFGLTESSEPEVQLAALSALARLDGLSHDAHDKTGRTLATSAGGMPADLALLLARSLLSGESRVRRLALAAATALTVGEFRRQGGALPVTDRQVTAESVIVRFAPNGYTREEESRALEALAEPLAQAAVGVVAASAEGADVVARMLLGQLSELAATVGEGVTEPVAERRVAGVLEAVGRATVDAFVRLTTHPSLEVRRHAVEVLSHRPEAQATEAVVAALDPRDPLLCRSALASLAKPAGNETIAAIIRLMGVKSDWALRSHAADALGRAQVAEGALSASIAGALVGIAETDRVGLVREAALRSMFARRARFLDGAAVELARRMSQRDGEPALRALAAELLGTPATDRTVP